MPEHSERLMLPHHHASAANPSRQSRPRANRIKSDALGDGGHEGREQAIRSRGSDPHSPSRCGIAPLTIYPIAGVFNLWQNAQLWHRRTTAQTTMKTRTNHGAGITLGTTGSPAVAPAATCSDSWEASTEEHARITFWRDAWAKANDNRKPPYLQTTQEYIERRWDRANRRMKRLMDRADAYRESHPNATAHARARLDPRKRRNRAAYARRVARLVRNLRLFQARIRFMCRASRFRS
jgi:hypothetical protein